MVSILNLDENLIAMVKNLHRACQDGVRITGMQVGRPSGGVDVTRAQAESVEVWKKLLVNIFVPVLKFDEQGTGEDGADVDTFVGDAGKAHDGCVQRRI